MAEEKIKEKDLATDRKITIKKRKNCDRVRRNKKKNKHNKQRERKKEVFSMPAGGFLVLFCSFIYLHF